MDYNNFEKNTIFEYWKTLIRKDILNIPSNKFLKKPYLENYIIQLSSIIDDNLLLEKILDLINNDEISCEEIILFLNNNFEWSSNEEKKSVELYFLENDIDEEIYLKISIETLIYQIKYFRLYLLISELLFDSIEENLELYYFIYLFIKNNKNDNRVYIKKNFKFKLFHYYINQLFENYLKLYNILIEHEFIKNKYCEKEIYNYYLKNIFINWYNIYKKDILENTVNDKIKNFQLKKNILSKILCIHNI